MIGLMMMGAALTASDVRPDGFYVAGVRQDMTVEEYNALIANGSYQSKPVRPDVFWATIERQDVFVTFCKGRIVSAVANYNSVEWMRSLQTLQGLGYKWMGVSPETQSEGTSQSGSLYFGVTIPKGYSYGIMPMVKGFVAGGRDIPSFQLHFEMFNNPCKAQQ